jgi:hypothetical protein
LDLFHEVYLDGLRPLDTEGVLGVERAIREGFAGVDLVAFLDAQAAGDGH